MQLHTHPFQDVKEVKTEYMTKQLLQLTDHHRMHCEAYADMLQAIGYAADKVTHYQELPYLPVPIFKHMLLHSLEDEEGKKTITSSGTGGATSQIILDGETRSMQQQVLAEIGMDVLGKKRLPMLVLDCAATVKKRDHFSARTAAIQGFSLFGARRTFALRDEDLSLDWDVVEAFLSRYGSEPFLIFGFTWLVWKCFVQELIRQPGRIDCSQGILVHGGGWKKLADEAVSKEAFRATLKQVCGIRRVHDYYGMAEQAGSIFMECECGHLHCSDYSAVLVRNPEDFSVCEPGETGLLQVMSVIPRSYPGHNLLTEDLGRILGVDDCPCGRAGTYFEVLGRAPKAEIRGCSDTMNHSMAIMKSADAEKQIDWLLGDGQIDANEKPFVPFASETLAFLEAVSEGILKHGEARTYQDLYSFGFWCRRKNLEHLKLAYPEKLIGKPVSFHVASGNIPMMFAFSMVSGLLAGTAVLVRLSRKETVQEQILLSILRKAMAAHPEFAKRIHICRYGHQDAFTAELSKKAQVRVLWGATESVQAIRAIPLNHPIRDLVFATRYSAAVLSAAEVLATEELDLLCRAFYNDTYLNDQNACSSPRLICWLGTETEIQAAKSRFWEDMKQVIAAQRYQVQATLQVDKLNRAMMFAAIFSCRCNVNQAKIVRIQVDQFVPEMWQHTGVGGFFLECDISSVADMRAMFDDGSCQTLGYYGVREDVLAEAFAGAMRKPDRLVPIGHAMDFSLFWDGCDLIREMSEPVGETLDI